MDNVSEQHMGVDGEQFSNLDLENFSDFIEGIDLNAVDPIVGIENEEIEWPDYLGERGLFDFREFGLGRRVFHAVYENTREERQKFRNYGLRTQG